MTWFVDEYLDSVLRDIDLCPGIDITFEIEREIHIGVFIFWHSPSMNVGWYPICQIDLEDQMIFHREGSENHEQWERLLTDAADRLKEELMKL